jgi:hypothetical protein
MQSGPKEHVLLEVCNVSTLTDSDNIGAELYDSEIDVLLHLEKFLEVSINAMLS